MPDLFCGYSAISQRVVMKPQHASESNDMEDVVSTGLPIKGVRCSYECLNGVLHAHKGCCLMKPSEKFMTPEERLTRIETQIEKQNAGIQGLIVVSRTVLTSIQELRADQEEIREEMRQMQKHTDEKINILINTVDRIIRRENHEP